MANGYQTSITNIPGLFDLNILDPRTVAHLGWGVLFMQSSHRHVWMLAAGDLKDLIPTWGEEMICNDSMHLYKGFSLARLDPETLPCFWCFSLVMSGREDHFALQRQWQFVPFPCTTVLNHRALQIASFCGSRAKDFIVSLRYQGWNRPNATFWNIRSKSCFRILHLQWFLTPLDDSSDATSTHIQNQKLNWDRIDFPASWEVADVALGLMAKKVDTFSDTECWSRANHQNRSQGRLKKLKRHSTSFNINILQQFSTLDPTKPMVALSLKWLTIAVC